MIPQAGHASNLDNPEAFTAVLLEFLDRVVPPLELVADGPILDRSADTRRRRGITRLFRPRAA